MKKILLYILASFIIVIICIFCYNLGLKNGLDKTTDLTNPTTTNENIIGIIDYPLIEFSFYPNIDNKWVIINRVGITSEDSKYYIIQENSVLHWQTDKIKLLTFQQGRGITPNGVFYIYNNMKLIKEVPYFEIFIDSDDIKNEFRHVPLNELETLINQKLPSAI